MLSKNIIPVVLVTLCFQLALPMSQAALTAQRVSVQEAAELLNQGAVFVDLRRDEAWETSDRKIKTAVRRNYKRAENWVRAPGTRPLSRAAKLPAACPLPRAARLPGAPRSSRK